MIYGMGMRSAWVAALTLAITACGSGDSEPKTSDIEDAAQAYSDAFLTGDGEAAYALLSQRCQDRTPEAEFTAITEQAAETYGSALDFETFDADVNGEQARVTYTYETSALDQTDEPWVNEGGGWRNDDC